MTAITAFLPVKQVDPIDVARERFNEAQARRRQTLNNRGYATVVIREPTDAQLRAAHTPQQVEALVISSTRPVNFAMASLVTPRRYPRVTTR
jgi:hypothetical protein